MTSEQELDDPLYEFGNLIRSNVVDPDDANLMRAFEQLRANPSDEFNVLSICNSYHGTPLDMAVAWKRDALVAALVPLYIAQIHSSSNDDNDSDDDENDGRDYDHDPSCNLLDALRGAVELGRVESVRVILTCLQSANITVSTLERRAPPGSEPVLNNAVLGFDRAHEYAAMIADCSSHGSYEDCGFDASVHRSLSPSEHSPATSLAIVQMLIDAGVNVHAANEMETMCTGFCRALELGELEIARALLAHDATVARTPRMHQGRGALQAAIDGNNLDCVKFVIESCGGAVDLQRVHVSASVSVEIAQYLTLARAQSASTHLPAVAST
jgi:hypothetical protein